MNELYTNVSLEAMADSAQIRAMAKPSSSVAQLSDRARLLPGSPIRALLSSARGNAELDLGGGIPDPALFPTEVLGEVTARVMRDGAAQALQYAPTEGLGPLRELIAQRLEQRGCRITSAEVIITHGAQQALATMGALLTSPTQAVALEQPVYPGALQAFSLAQAPILPLPVTSDGWALEAIDGKRPSAMYVIPSFQNPTGRAASAAERRRLAEYAESTGTFVIEDDAYGELDFESRPLRPILADAPTRGILLGSFSKTLCPGLRVGWVAAPKELVSPIVRILQASSLQPGTLAQHLVRGLLDSLDWEGHLANLRMRYAERARALRARCAEVGLIAAMPRGGFFLWAKSPGNATHFAELAAAGSVSMVPERAFYGTPHSGPDRHLRLAFSRFLDLPRDRSRLQAVARTYARSLAAPQLIES